MSDEFHASKPIYLQAVDRIYFSIVRGDIKHGEKLPSVRDMAVQMGVNPNTIQRTYAEMERDGMVETKRGQGTYVKNDPVVVVELRNRIKTGIVADFVESMSEIGLTKDEMLDGLEQFFSKWEGKS